VRDRTKTASGGAVDKVQSCCRQLENSVDRIDAAH